MKIEAGTSQDLLVAVERIGCKGPVALEVKQLPVDITSKPVVLPADKNEITLQLTAVPKAKEAVFDAKVVALLGTLMTEKSVRVSVQSQTVAKEIINSIGMKLTWIPPGNFMMGTSKSEQEDLRKKQGSIYSDVAAAMEVQHRVTLTKGFYLGIHSVTQGEWRTVMGKNPTSSFKGDNLPVDSAAWLDAIAYCNALSKKDVRKPYYKIAGKTVTILGGNGYRLPTEAEWEYACRAGSTTAYCFGDALGTLGEYAWYGGNASGTTHPVRQKKANRWGLYDMHGNILEWYWDWYGDYPAEECTDPVGPPTGRARVLRGGSWLFDGGFVRSASRQSGSEKAVFPLRNLWGFRVCCWLD
jgi:formylglycine-generating enzyme required for sulfatase activity